MEMKFLIDGQEHIGTVDDNGYVSVTFTKNTRDGIEVIPLESCGGVTFVDDIQLEKGDTATPYENPALIQGSATGLIKDIRALQYSIHDPERGLTSRFAQLAQGFEQEVVDLIGGYSRQGQTIDGLFTDIYSPDGRVSQAIQTVDGFKQTVDDLEAGTGTTFEQLSNGFRQRIDEYLGNSRKFSQVESSVDAIELAVGDPDSLATTLLTSELWRTEVTNLTQQRVADELKQEFETVEGEVPFYENTRTRALLQGDRSTAIYLPLNADYIVEGKRVYVDVTYEVSEGGKGNHTGYIQYGDIQSDEMTLFSSLNNVRFVMYVPTGTRNGNIIDLHTSIVDSGNYTWATITNITVSTVEETEVPIEGEETGAISSQITQLYNMINLSILGQDGAMSRIAMGEEGIQIDGKLLHITAKTYIDDAVIKSAMIDTLDAGKITTGELNASLIRVVNLDANSISGNEANFIKAMFSGTISTLQITSNGVNILDNSGRSSTFLDSSGIEFTRAGINLGKLEYVTNTADSGDLYGMNGFSMRPNRNSYFGVSYFPTSTATASIRRFAVSGRTGNVYISGLIKPSESQIYGIDITWGGITGRSTNVRIMNHDRTGGIQINNGDLAYLSTGGWRSLNDWIT